MAEIKLEKRYPDIPEETVIEIFQRGYLEGWNNAREREHLDLRLAEAIPVEWIRKWHGIDDIKDYDLREYVKCTILYMLKDWKNENEID